MQAKHLVKRLWQFIFIIFFSPQYPNWLSKIWVKETDWRKNAYFHPFKCFSTSLVQFLSFFASPRKERDLFKMVISTRPSYSYSSSSSWLWQKIEYQYHILDHLSSHTIRSWSSFQRILTQMTQLEKYIGEEIGNGCMYIIVYERMKVWSQPDVCYKKNCKWFPHKFSHVGWTEENKKIYMDDGGADGPCFLEIFFSEKINVFLAGILSPVMNGEGPHRGVW